MLGIGSNSILSIVFSALHCMVVVVHDTVCLSVCTHTAHPMFSLSIPVHYTRVSASLALWWSQSILGGEGERGDSALFSRGSSAGSRIGGSVFTSMLLEDSNLAAEEASEARDDRALKGICAGVAPGSWKAFTTRIWKRQKRKIHIRICGHHMVDGGIKSKVNKSM